jgi:hypothetical protein
MRAHSLEDRPPTTDLWAGVAERIGVAAPRPAIVPLRRRFTFSLPQLLAASIALAVVSASGAWMLRPAVQTVVVQPTPPGAGTVPVTQVSAPSAAQSYDAAVNDLERILEDGRGRLDTATVRILEQNLAIIDRAIADARRAVAADSANVYLNTHLAETMRRKVDLLRQAAALVAAVS